MSGRYFLIIGGALGASRGSQRRFRSLSILCMIFESSSLARESCFLMPHSLEPRLSRSGFCLALL